MKQWTRRPISPRKATQRGGWWVVPRMQTTLPVASSVSAAGTAAGPLSSSLGKQTRKAAQQAPQLRQTDMARSIPQRRPVAAVRPARIAFLLRVARHTGTPESMTMPAEGLPIRKLSALRDHPTKS